MKNNIMKLCSLDSDSLIYIVCHNKKKLDLLGNIIEDDLGKPVREEKSLQECKDLADDMIKNILRATKSSHYIIALTVGKNFRYEIQESYKSNRKNGEKPRHFDGVKEHLLVKWKAYYNTFYEADDIVNACRFKYENSFIASPDKDILYLEGTHFDYRNMKWIQTSKEEAELKFWKDMIIGQSGDGIKGLVGKGVKFADRLIGDAEHYPDKVLMAYIQDLGEEEGIQEFYKNYSCLKIKDKLDGFYPEPIAFVDDVQERDTEEVKWN